MEPVVVVINHSILNRGTCTSYDVVMMREMGKCREDLEGASRYSLTPTGKTYRPFERRP